MVHSGLSERSLNKNLIFVFSPLVEMLSDIYFALIPLFFFKFHIVRLFHYQFSFYTIQREGGEVGFLEN
jgi:hypothetical protein